MSWKGLQTQGNIPQEGETGDKNRTNISDRQLLHRSVWRSSKEHLIPKARTLWPPVTVSGGFKKSIQRVSGAALNNYKRRCESDRPGGGKFCRFIRLPRNSSAGLPSILGWRPGGVPGSVSCAEIERRIERERAARREGCRSALVSSWCMEETVAEFHLTGAPGPNIMLTNPRVVRESASPMLLLP